MRQWTPAQRQRQAELIRNWKPWEHSTGAITPDGKKQASRNAYKGGARQQLRALRAMMREWEEERQEM